MGESYAWGICPMCNQEHTGLDGDVCIECRDEASAELRRDQFVAAWLFDYYNPDELAPTVRMRECRPFRRVAFDPWSV
jgi:hypothetical protein